MKILKRYVEEFCFGCGLLLRSPRSGYYCFKYDIHKTKGQEGIPEGDVSELPEKLKEYLGIPADATEWPDTCKDFTPKAETRYVLRIEEDNSPRMFGDEIIVSPYHSDAVLTVEPLGYSIRIDGYEWYLENNKYIPVEMEQPVEIEQ